MAVEPDLLAPARRSPRAAARGARGRRAASASRSRTGDRGRLAQARRPGGRRSVPLRSPRSCPPPSNSGVSRTWGSRRRTYKCADPLRAVDLVGREAEQVDRRRPGRRAGPCRRPGWRRCGRRRPRSWQSRPISAIGLIVPTSLFAAMTETRTVRSVSASATASAETRPDSSGGTTVTSHPSRASRFIGSSTALCSVGGGDEVVPLRLRAGQRPLDRQVVRLGRPRGEDDLPRLGPDQRRRPARGPVDGRARRPSRTGARRSRRCRKSP